MKGSDSNFWTSVRIAAATGGRWLKKPPDPATPISGLGIDWRALRPGEVFVAIDGEQFDGHEFLPQAQAAGAAMALVERSIPREGPEGPPLPPLRVPSTVEALRALAGRYREVLSAGGCRLVSVSGSNGKTTTRYLIHHTLKRMSPSCNDHSRSPDLKMPLRGRLSLLSKVVSATGSATVQA